MAAPGPTYPSTGEVLKGSSGGQEDQFTLASVNGRCGSRAWKNASYDVSEAPGFLAVTVEAPVDTGSAA